MLLTIPRVTIVVPCYKQAQFLRVTLASVYAQTYIDWECLVIDDGSPDETSHIAKEWAEKDSRFCYHRKENGGLSSARNFGLKLARGRYIQFLDSDDVLKPEKLATQVCELDSFASHSIAFCDYCRGLDSNIYLAPKNAGHYLPPTLGHTPSIFEIAADWETRISIPVHCFLLSRTFFDDGLIFDESLVNHEDWDLWMQLFRIAKKVIYSPDIHAIYRQHDHSMCLNLPLMREGFLKAIDKQLLISADNIALQTVLRLKRSEIDLIYKEKIRSTSPVHERILFFAKLTLERFTSKLRETLSRRGFKRF